MIEEAWRPVVGWEDYYEVSNLGQVRSLDRLCWNGQARWLKKGKLIKPTLKTKVRDCPRYLQVRLSVEGQQKTLSVHRLVAKAWVPNPENLPEVNHLDEDPFNNQATNLEWCTRSQNMRHGTAIQRITATRRKRGFKEILARTKPIIQMDKAGNTIQVFPSTAEAARQLGLYAANITKACRGQIKTTGKFTFKYQ